MGFLLLGLAVMLLIIGYVVPTFVLPIVTDNVWVGALPCSRPRILALLVGMMLLLAGGGLACLAAAAASKRRDPLVATDPANFISRGSPLELTAAAA